MGKKQTPGAFGRAASGRNGTDELARLRAELQALRHRFAALTAERDWLIEVIEWSGDFPVYRCAAPSCTCYWVDTDRGDTPLADSAETAAIRDGWRTYTRDQDRDVWVAASRELLHLCPHHDPPEGWVEVWEEWEAGAAEFLGWPERPAHPLRRVASPGEATS